MRRRRFRDGYRPSSASLSRPRQQDRNGSMRSNFDGFRMSARIERERVQLLTRTGLDWSEKYPNVIAALAKCGSRPLTSTANYAALAMTDCRAFHGPRRRATARTGFGWSNMSSTFSIWTAATPPACRSSSAKRF